MLCRVRRRFSSACQIISSASTCRRATPSNGRRRGQGHGADEDKGRQKRGIPRLDGGLCIIFAGRLQSRARLFSSHLESPRVEFAEHASLFRGFRHSSVNRGKEL